ERLADAAQHTAELARVPEARRPSAEEDALDAPALERRRPGGELAQDGVGVRRVVDGLALPRVADEVAVRALGQAPGKMDVDAAPGSVIPPFPAQLPHCIGSVTFFRWVAHLAAGRATHRASPYVSAIGRFRPDPASLRLLVQDARGADPQVGSA